MSIIIKLPKRSKQTSPLTAYQWDVEVVDVIEDAFAQVTNNTGSVSSVSATVPTGLSVNVVNSTTTPAINITNNMAAGIVKSSGVNGSLVSVPTITIAETTGVVPINRGGTNSITALVNGRIIISDSGAMVEANTTTYPNLTELSYLKGATSSIQAQIDTKQPTITVLPTLNGGTGYAATGRQDLIDYLSDTSTAGTGDVLTFDGTNMVLSPPTAAGVSSINGVTGAVTLTTTNLLASFGWTGANLNIPTASGTIQGLLSQTDWSTFNAKLSGVLTDGSIYIGNSSNVATARVVSGDITITNTGVVTIANNAITEVKIANNAVTSDKIINDAIVTAKIANNNVTGAKLENSGVGAGTYGGSTLSASIIVDSKGRVTSATNVTISAVSPTNSALVSGNFWVGNASNLATPVLMSGDATLGNSGAITLESTGVVAGTYNNITVDAKGRITSIASLTGFVPYTGANANLNMGANNIITTNLNIGAVSAAADLTIIKAKDGGQGSVGAFFDNTDSDSGAATSLILKTQNVNFNISSFNNLSDAVTIQTTTASSIKIHSNLDPTKGLIFLADGNINIASGSKLRLGSLTTPAANILDIKDSYSSGLRVLIENTSSNISGFASLDLVTQAGIRTVIGSTNVAVTGFGQMGTFSNHDMILYANSISSIHIKKTGDVGFGNTAPLTFGGFRTVTIGGDVGLRGVLAVREPTSSGNIGGNLFTTPNGVTLAAIDGTKNLYLMAGDIERVSVLANGNTLFKTLTDNGQTVQINGGISAVLPTSSAGLPTGAMWNDSGTVKIV